MPKVKTGLRITSRDIQIFRELFEHKIMTTEQIHREHFKGAEKRRVNRRLKKLFDAKFIVKKPLLEKNNVFFTWSLQSAGLNLLRPYLPYKVIGHELESYCPYHDLALYEVRKQFEKRSGVINYYTENHIQNSNYGQDGTRFRDLKKINCDAVAEIRTLKGNFDFAIEFERFTKMTSRIRRYFTNLYNSEIQGVFFICQNQGTINALMKVERDVVKKLRLAHMVRYATLSRVLSEESEINFTTATGSDFTLL